MAFTFDLLSLQPVSLAEVFDVHPLYLYVKMDADMDIDMDIDLDVDPEIAQLEAEAMRIVRRPTRCRISNCDAKTKLTTVLIGR